MLLTYLPRTPREHRGIHFQFRDARGALVTPAEMVAVTPTGWATPAEELNYGGVGLTGDWWGPLLCWKHRP